MEDEDYHELLESKRLEIIKHLQIDRPFVFDYLRHKRVLDPEDCELIQCEKTTSLKIGKFVDVLARKGAQAYQHLLEGLQLEHPALYEKLTGKEADATISPILRKLKNSFIGVGGPMGNGELEILTRHLERTYGDLHEMSRRFEQVVQHKKDIEDKLETTTSDLQRHKEEVNFLKKEIDSKRSSVVPETNNSWPQYIEYMDKVRKEISDRDIYIIALQTNLMSSREEIDDLKKKYDHLLEKNGELQKMVEEMSESYHKKKFESMRLSERIERQGNEIKKAEQTMRKYRECQFHNMKLREEKERLQEELDELIKWTETLKTRYDIVEYENTRTLCRNTAIMADYGSMQEELMKCREEMNEVQLVAEDLRERIRHLEHDRQTYKRQRDGAFMARREAILDRDKAFLERDQALKKYNDIKAGNDAAIENEIMQLKSYDEAVARSDVMEEEIKQVKKKLRQSERELEELKVKCGVEVGEESDEEKQDGAANFSEEQVNDPENNTLDKKPEGSSSPSTQAIVKSIKRRVAPPSPSIAASTPPPFYGSPTYTFSNSEPIFPAELFPSTNFQPSPGVGGKESPKLTRKCVSRVPIKMRQSEKDEENSQDENQDGGKDPEKKWTTTTTQNSDEGESDESVAKEQALDEEEVSESSDRSNNTMHHYLTRL